MAFSMRLVAIHLGRRCTARSVTKNLALCNPRANTYHRYKQMPSSSAHRFFATTMPDDLLNKRLDAFQELFVEARYCIEDVIDSAETTYFDDDAKAAQEAVDVAVKEFTTLLNDIEDPDQKNLVLRGNGLKVEQLKGELEMAIKGDH
jgi:hypothetical protein